MALQSEVWVNDIEEKLFEGSEFVNRSMNHDAFIVNSTVHVPQSGTIPAVEKNRSSFPATAAERTDTELTYSVDSFTTDPIRVGDFDDLQTSYAKRQSVMSQHIEKISEEIGTQTAFNWAPEGNNTKVILTTGASTSLGPDGVTARKKIVTADIAGAAQKLDKDKVSPTGRFLLMELSMYYELFSIEELTRKDFMDRTSLPAGVIDRLFGFNIMVRPTTVIYDVSTPATPALEAIGAAADANSSFGCIGWQQNYVAKALGSTGVFLDENDPLHYGSVMSAEVALGSSVLRNDTRVSGVVAIAQSA